MPFLQEQREHHQQGHEKPPQFQQLNHMLQDLVGPNHF
uniref:Uncharacterized protein n=1 Tax=Rhizophora mucronata TaxID=61149 RepID=A0A2P2Q444_RHIMU